jgi:hypothetical protein
VQLGFADAIAVHIPQRLKTVEPVAFVLVSKLPQDAHNLASISVFKSAIFNIDMDSNLLHGHIPLNSIPARARFGRFDLSGLDQ